jgi:hypothetical protein
MSGFTSQKSARLETKSWTQARLSVQMLSPTYVFSAFGSYR